MSLLPLLLVGDGPQEATGLGRIHRDLGAHITASGLPVELVSIGGSTPPTWEQWRHFPIDRVNDDWGASQVEAYYRDLFGDRPGVVWVIWDPARLWAYVDLPSRIPVELWSYPAIDATNVNGTISGPAAEALRRVDRVVAYGKWASHIVKGITGKGQWVPHGIAAAEYSVVDDRDIERETVLKTLGRYYKPDQTLIGCVATNQPRKDLGMVFQTVQELRRRGRNAYLWLHTDVLIKAWSVQQLAEDCDLLRRVTVTTDELTDAQLIGMYRACDLTLAPGLGEGFGYPIVESLAAGTIPIHVDYAGGAELLPKTEWRVPVREWRLEGVYALRRPVTRVEDWANAVERALGWREAVGREVSREYCRGAVAGYDWKHLWERWQSWIRAGIEGRSCAVA